MNTPISPEALPTASLFTLLDWGADSIKYILDLSTALKQAPRASHRPLIGQSIALLFEKRSTRTRCAFETAANALGASTVFLGSEDIHLGTKESLEDTARLLGRMFDAVAFRGFLQSTLTTLANHSGIPVYNALTDRYHPTQALADMLTIREQHGALRGVSVAYVGDARNNVARSFVIAGTKMGLDMRIAAPNSLMIDEETLALCQAFAAKSGGAVARFDDPIDAVRSARVVYTDVWVSMGEEERGADRMNLLRRFQVNEALMAHAASDAIFMHCLPAVRGNEVTEAVIDGGQSRIWDEAENRKHTIGALMIATLSGARTAADTLLNNPSKKNKEEI